MDKELYFLQLAMLIFVCLVLAREAEVARRELHRLHQRMRNDKWRKRSAAWRLTVKLCEIGGSLIIVGPVLFYSCEFYLLVTTVVIGPAIHSSGLIQA